MFSLSRHPAKPAAGNTGSATSPAVSSQPTSRLTSSRRHPSSSPIVRRANRRTLATVASLLAAGLTLTACGGDSSNPTDATTEAPQLTVLSHDSFVLTDEAMTAFEVETGIDVTYLAPGDAGSVVNQLILTRDHPLGDVVFGIDNTLAGRALEADVLDPYQSPDLPLGLDALKADDTNRLTPIDYGDVCVNADPQWFTDNDLALPQSLPDLIKPEYANLLVVMNPATSSPGLAFLAATVGAFGETGYLDYWRSLVDNRVRVTSGWSEAYNVDFSGSAGHGAYPLVVSYASSPLAELDDAGHPTTVNLPETCFRQVEYAGVLAGAANPTGAQQFIDFLLSPTVQAEIPDTMYMTPVDPNVELPAGWAEQVAAVTNPITLPIGTINSQRETWVNDWTNLVLG